MSSRKAWSLVQEIGAGIGALLLFVTLTPVVNLVAEKLTRDWYAGDGDVLVVLGGSMLVPGTGPDATLGYDSYLRCVYAGWNLQTYTYRYVVVSGSDGLAQAMAKFLQASVPQPPSILLETRARSTYENAIYVKALLQHYHVPAQSSRVVILTSDFHCWRAQRVFERSGLQVRVIPVPDVAKRAGSWTYRLAGFFTLLDELGKCLVYNWQGKM